jgi:hypothetical protein
VLFLPAALSHASNWNRFTNHFHALLELQLPWFPLCSLNNNFNNSNVICLVHQNRAVHKRTLSK